MQRNLSAVLVFTLATLAGLQQAPAAAAQGASYPAKPIRLIIANTTGTSVDTLSRVLAARMGDALGQQMVADNRGGAGGTIGAEIAAHATPDGYTLFLTSTGVQVVSPQLYKKLNYHPVKDFEPISLFAITQNILVVNSSLPFKSVKDLLAYARANPGKLNMSNAGSGFQSHLAGVLFAHMADINVRHVPYKGGASLIAVMANESQFTIAPGPSLLGHVRAGRLRALATGGEKRSPLTPELPTISESGVPGFVSTGWAGLMAPKKTPKPVLDKLHATLVKVINDPVTREQLERQGGEPTTSTSQEMITFIGKEYERFGQAIKIAGLDIQ
ncbi:MAG TPA: tripartite tricarboxylate transporter substrate binding protein [Burkholderiales bacterium]|nr:tripartite tricarboxylate transporter substrate binding protein [Burkholderiales bacterium]